MSTLTLAASNGTTPARTVTRAATTPPEEALESAREAADTPEAAHARRSATEAALGRLGVAPDSPLGRQLAALLGDVWRAGVVHGHQAACDDTDDDPKAGA
jgi:hypothetical protein